MALPESKVVFDRTKIERFKSKDYRTSFMSTRVRSSIASQIRELREASRMSQSELAERIGTRQSAVSRLENTEYGRASVQTLLDVATALDVALVVKYVSYEEFLFQHGNVKPSALSAETFASTYERYSSKDTQHDTYSKILQRIFERSDANGGLSLTTLAPQQQSIGSINRGKTWPARIEDKNSNLGIDRALPLHTKDSGETAVTITQDWAA